MGDRRNNRPCLVFDVGGTSTRAAIYLPEADSLMSCTRIATPNLWNRPARVQHQIVRDVLHVIEQLGHRVLGSRSPGYVAMAFAGPILNGGEVTQAPTIWGPALPQPIKLRKELEQLWPGAAVDVLNDVTAAGYRYLHAQNESFCILTISSGIGHKVFIEGRPFVGPAGRGGEIGHLRVDFSEQAVCCDCGGYGHLGAIASGRGVLQHIRRKAAGDHAAFVRSLLYDVIEGSLDALTTERVVDPFHRNDRWTRERISETTQPLGQAIAGIHLGLGIERFVLIGGFALALGEPYRRLVAQAGREAAWHSGREWDEMVELGKDDDNSGLIGAGRYVTDNYRR